MAGAGRAPFAPAIIEPSSLLRRLRLVGDMGGPKDEVDHQAKDEPADGGDEDRPGAVDERVRPPLLNVGGRRLAVPRQQSHEREGSAQAERPRPLLEESLHAPQGTAAPRTGTSAPTGHRPPRLIVTGVERLTDAGLEILDEGECVRLLGTTAVGRVAFSVGDAVAVLPVNHAMLGSEILFFTGPGLKLDAVLTARTVTFEADEIDAWRGRGGVCWPWAAPSSWSRGCGPESRPSGSVPGRQATGTTWSGSARRCCPAGAF